MELDAAQDLRPLSDGEFKLRRDLKSTVLALASMSRTIARQRSRLRHISRRVTRTHILSTQEDLIQAWNELIHLVSLIPGQV